MRPFLSVVIPVYNREKFVRRCIDSILLQDCTDYEIIAVDDGSSDRSVAVLQSYVDDSRFRLIEHPKNQGVMAARNTGWQFARGQWIVGLDSDDELVKGSLAVIHRRLSLTPSDIMLALFHCRLDGGYISPDPPFTEPCLLDYEAYLKTLESHFNRRCDTLHCMRVGVGLDLSTVGLEELFCLDIHKRWKSLVYPEVVLLYHQDSGNQLSKFISGSPQDDINLTQARINMLERLIVSPGDALKKIAPRWFHQHASHLATLQFALGYRRKGLAYSAQAIQTLPTNARSWIVPLLGVCSGNVLVWCRAVKRFFRQAAASRCASP